VQARNLQQAAAEEHCHVAIAAHHVGSKVRGVLLML
jgi:hypothetical protein